MNEEVVAYELGAMFALKMDANDPLASFRRRFCRTPTRSIWTETASGLMSKDAEETLNRVVNEWKTFGVGGWGRAKIPWVPLRIYLGKRRPVYRSEARRSYRHNSTTVNLHNLVATFYKPKGKRRKILADELNFPSDLYALTSQILLAGESEKDLILVKNQKRHHRGERSYRTHE